MASDRLDDLGVDTEVLEVAVETVEDTVVGTGVDLDVAVDTEGVETAVTFHWTVDQLSGVAADQQHLQIEHFVQTKRFLCSGLFWAVCSAVHQLLRATYQDSWLFHTGQL